MITPARGRANRSRRKSDDAGRGVVGGRQSSQVAPTEGRSAPQEGQTATIKRSCGIRPQRRKSSNRSINWPTAVLLLIV